MEVWVYTGHTNTCLKLMEDFALPFNEKKVSSGGSGSTIWFEYTTDQFRPLWESWLRAAKEVGLVYDWKIK